MLRSRLLDGVAEAVGARCVLGIALEVHQHILCPGRPPIVAVVEAVRLQLCDSALPKEPQAICL